MSKISINADRLLGRLRELGEIGRDPSGHLTRLAASDADKLGRDTFIRWVQTAGLDVRVDRLGNIFGIWGELSPDRPGPLLVGSHIDTVIDAGKLDGCYGVLAGLEVIQTLMESGKVPDFPIAVAAFTNEEGVRFAPDMMGSAVFAGALSADAALGAFDTNGSTLGEELERIGYAGAEPVGFFRPRAYLELHIEQGPVLEREGVDIGVVEGVQGISWQRITVEGQANHAGTTPMSMRRDAGVAAARITTFLDELANAGAGALVATVGCINFSPNAVNVVPGKVSLTVDMRSPDLTILKSAETRLAGYLDRLSGQTGCAISSERLAMTDPVLFDKDLVRTIERVAAARGLSSRRMTSGAGHDAQLLADIAPTAMIFVPSVGGISHSPKEHTPDDHLVHGANVLLETVQSLSLA
ncbi:Zn-dependent hydrolase [Aquamicrobium sp. LC103]|uniref:Zn-dependent hydrolase n=1 Tax=Aquamicrobium sp. LC103 TaxID=1120658 RepID=UPI00063ECC86|nr:Zn-dependent hydrolase [Aquamicrobium sp. LC103]TKT69421.1 Zn-dependent hydrolase [Aquamicrobium sp. LC103]